MKKNYRNLTEREKEILDFLLKEDFPGRDELVIQVANSKVRTIQEYNDNWGSLEFLIKTDIRANVNERVPVQASTLDRDNIPITVLLHVVSGNIDELEIIKADNSPIIKPFTAADLRIDKVKHENQ